MNKKIVHQISTYPILEWKEIEVWFYILTKGLMFNSAYRKGFGRVGCMYCPNNIPYNEYLIKIYYPEESQKWLNFLIDYAKQLDKNDPNEYVTAGAWKMRVGKTKGKTSAYVKKVPCLKNTSAMHFILDKEIASDFKERFKPFGSLEEFEDSIGEGFIVKDVKSENPLFMIKRVKDINILKEESKIDPTWNLSKEFLCVDLLTAGNGFYLLKAIERQLRKFQVCILCGACIGVCPTNAISINPHFKISEDRCIQCGRCISPKFIKSGCVSLNSQQQSKEFSNVNRF